MTTASNLRYDRSPISSPARKKRKLDFSSPVCPELELSLEDLHALDEIEFRLSQSSHPSSQSPSKPYPTENPFHAPNPAPAFLGFSAASAIAISHDDSAYVDRSSPDPPEEKDYSAWFESSGIPTIDGSQTTVAFTSASAMSSTPLFSSASALMDEQRSSALGFRTVGKGAGLLIPSAVALAKAEETLKQWQEEEAQQEESPHTSSAQSRSPLRTVQHRMPEPETPCPPSHSLGFASASQLSKGFTRPSSKSSSFVSPLINKTKSQNTDPNRPRPFKPPTLNTPVTPAQSSSSAAPAFTSARSQHPLAAPPFNATPARTRGDNISSDSTPCVASSSISYQHHTERSAHIFVTPVRRESNSNLAHAQSAGRIRTTPAKFVTPFKKGMRPGEAGRAELEARQKLQQPPRTPMKSMFRDFASGKIPKDQSLQMPRVFDLTPPPNRLSLQDSGLLPQQYTAEEMSSYGIAIEELSQIATPSLASYYSFYNAPQVSNSPSVHLEDQIGPAIALDKLLAHGCSRATKTWVDNAWCLILWKLAGMVTLEPERESGIPTFGGATAGPRWCWDEVWKQLLYRYEREMNLGQRPPFHLITTQDHPASPPMVLCISNVIWPEGSGTPDGRQANPLPQLEVTDGWYRLKAQIDLTMARAVKRGKLRVGRKIAVVGARLDTERKDPLEPLEAFQSTKLILSSNSSQLAPWHAKLGFQRGPFIFTMHSLTAEGGNVALMDLVVLQVHPIAYLEIRTGRDGQKHQDGPRSEADEAACKEQWRKRREAAESKIFEAHEKKITRYLSYADRLDQRVARSARAIPEDPPDNIDSLYDELEEPGDATQLMTRIKSSDAAWLARYIRERLEKDQEKTREELEKEVDDLCPPRNIRSFRVLITRDSRTSKFPANRVAQVTVWDVLDLQLTEDKPRGHFEVGWRCLVTNLMPSAKTAWMDHGPGSQIFLVSTRASKWQRLKRLE